MDMTAEEVLRKYIHNDVLIDPPPNWRVFDRQGPDENGERTASIALEGYIINVNDELDIGHGHHHILMSDEFVPPGDIISTTFTQTEAGGVYAQIQPNVVLTHGVYFKQIHLAEPYSIQWEIIQAACGKPVKIRIEGKVRFYNLQMAQDDHDREIAARGWFEDFDRSTKCPFVFDYELEMVGRRIWKCIEFRLPFTNITISPMIFIYKPPAPERIRSVPNRIIQSGQIAAANRAGMPIT